jgi:hypothetical protein
MQARLKVVELGGKRYQLRRLPPDVGSFVFMRMMGLSIRASQAEAEKAPTKQYASKLDTKPTEQKLPEKVTGEMRVRALAFSVFSGGVSFEDFQFIQTACIKAVGRIDTAQGVDFPIPIMQDSGQWADLDIADNVGLVMQLTTEVLIHSFSSFFDETSAG